MNCCVNNLGEFPHNADIDTGIQADQDGTYVLKIDFAGSSLMKSATPGNGNNIIIPRPFNENGVHGLTIKKPDGNILEVDGCPNFKFKTFVAITEECAEIECEEYE